VFTARYALSPYITQIRFVFKGLIRFMARYSDYKIRVHIVKAEDGPLLYRAR
jgi:hypothetical protein